MGIKRLFESLRKLKESEIEDVLKKNNTIAFDNGVVLGVEYEDGKLYAGSITNTGIMREYEIDYDTESSVDSNLQALYDTVIEEHPEYLDEATKLHETAVYSNGYEVIIHKKDGVERFIPAEMTADDVVDKFQGIMKHSVGRAWQWLKKVKRKEYDEDYEPIEENIVPDSYVYKLLNGKVFKDYEETAEFLNKNGFDAVKEFREGDGYNVVATCKENGMNAQYFIPFIPVKDGFTAVLSEDNLKEGKLSDFIAKKIAGVANKGNALNTMQALADELKTMYKDYIIDSDKDGILIKPAKDYVARINCKATDKGLSDITVVNAAGDSAPVEDFDKAKEALAKFLGVKADNELPTTGDATEPATDASAEGEGTEEFKFDDNTSVAELAKKTGKTADEIKSLLGLE